MDFRALTQRYMKSPGQNLVEGISTLFRCGDRAVRRPLLEVRKRKATDRRDNYAQVAILADEVIPT